MKNSQKVPALSLQTIEYTRLINLNNFPEALKICDNVLTSPQRILTTDERTLWTDRKNTITQRATPRSHYSPIQSISPKPIKTRTFETVAPTPTLADSLPHIFKHKAWIDARDKLVKGYPIEALNIAQEMLDRVKKTTVATSGLPQEVINLRTTHWQALYDHMKAMKECYQLLRSGSFIAANKLVPTERKEIKAVKDTQLQNIIEQEIKDWEGLTKIIENHRKNASKKRDNILATELICPLDPFFPTGEALLKWIDCDADPELHNFVSSHLNTINSTIKKRLLLSIAVSLTLAITIATMPPFNGSPIIAFVSIVSLFATILSGFVLALIMQYQSYTQAAFQETHKQIKSNTHMNTLTTIGVFLT